MPLPCPPRKHFSYSGIGHAGFIFGELKAPDFWTQNQVWDCASLSRPIIFSLQMILVAILLMIMVGLALGLLGSGGSIVALPVLVYVAHVPSHQAVGMSLVIVGGTSTLGCLLSQRRGNFNFRPALLFAFSGLPGAYWGASFTHLVSDWVLLLAFGVLLLLAGSHMLFGHVPAQPSPQCRPWSSSATGFAVGILTGFLGVGGGIIVLPALVFFAGLEMKAAIGTSLAIIAANCLAGLIGQIRYLALDLPLTFSFLAAAVAGMFGGQTLAAWISSPSLRRIFGWSVIALGAFILLKQIVSVLVAQ